MRPTIITETRIEIADRHTTLRHLNAAMGVTTPLALGNEAGYKQLYSKTVSAFGIDYGVLTGASAKLLGTLYPVFKKEELTKKKGFWYRYLGFYPTAEVAWAQALPIQCKIKSRIEGSAPPGLKAKISVVPYVLLYPFGWSAWMSVRVTCDHTLPELRQIVDYLLKEAAFSVAGTPGTVDLNGVFDSIAAGVRSDAFGGTDAFERSSADLVTVTTVLSKRGPSLSLGALSAEDNDEENIRRLARPTGNLGRHTLKDLVWPLEQDADRNYMVIDKLGRFTWLEKLLAPEGHNWQWLRCYHGNSFIALVQAWQFEGLTAAAAKSPNPMIDLDLLLKTAGECLKAPPFKNASVMGFVKELAVPPA